MTPDRRLTPPPVPAGSPLRVIAPSAPLRREPSPGAALDSEVLRGEAVTPYDTDGAWTRVQLTTDGYVGWVPTIALGAPAGATTHCLAVPRSFVYPVADMKVPPVDALSLGARVTVVDRAETRGLLYAQTDDGGFLVEKHLVALDARSPDPVAIARSLLGAPYLWGGRTSLGLDCSALVQLAFAAAGVALPRDSDQQQAVALAVEAPGHGDLAFWPGHVGLVGAGDRLVHASGFHMLVVEEPLGEAIARIASAGSPLSGFRRIPRQ